MARTTVRSAAAKRISFAISSGATSRSPDMPSALQIIRCNSGGSGNGGRRCTVRDALSLATNAASGTRAGVPPRQVTTIVWSPARSLSLMNASTRGSDWRALRADHKRRLRERFSSWPDIVPSPQFKIMDRKFWHSLKRQPNGSPSHGAEVKRHSPPTRQLKFAQQDKPGISGKCSSTRCGGGATPRRRGRLALAAITKIGHLPAASALVTGVASCRSCPFSGASQRSLPPWRYLRRPPSQRRSPRGRWTWPRC